MAASTIEDATVALGQARDYYRDRFAPDSVSEALQILTTDDPDFAMGTLAYDALYVHFWEYHHRGFDAAVAATRVFKALGRADEIRPI